MGEVRRVSVDVSGESAAVIDQMVASGQFKDDQDGLRYALLRLREWPSDDAGDLLNPADHLDINELRRFWEEGLASGESIEGNFDSDDIKRRGMTRLSQARAAHTHRG